MQELLNNLSFIFKNQKELEDHLEALTKINNPANLNAYDLIIFQEMIEIIKKQQQQLTTTTIKIKIYEKRKINKSSPRNFKSI